MAGERSIERTVRIEAPPEVVFGFLTDPDLMPQWMGSGAELDPRPGGVFRCAMMDRRFFVRGEFIEVERPHRIVFTWGWEGSDRLVPPGSTRVEFTLRREGDDTLLTIRHTGLPAGHERFHAMGWKLYLARLGDIAAGREPRQEEWQPGSSELQAAVAALPPSRN